MNDDVSNDSWEKRMKKMKKKKPNAIHIKCLNVKCDIGKIGIRGFLHISNAVRKFRFAETWKARKAFVLPWRPIELSIFSTFFHGAFVHGWVKVLCKLKMYSVDVNVLEKRQSKQSAQRQRRKSTPLLNFRLKVFLSARFRVAKTGWPQCENEWKKKWFFAAGASHTLAHTEYIWNYWSCAIHLRTSARFHRSQYKSKLSFFWAKNIKKKFYVIYNHRDASIGRYAWRTEFAACEKWMSTWIKLDENKIAS